MYVPDRGSIALSDIAASMGREPYRLATLFGERAWLYRSGRLAILAGLRLAGAGPKRRIWLPAYLCRAALEPVLHCRLRVSWYDITDDLAPRGEVQDAAAGDFVMLVHFFGLTAPARQLRSVCRARAMRFVEDCAHGLPDPASSVQMGSFGDIAVFSLRKQLPVPDGGVLVVNDPAAPQPAPPSPRANRVGAALRLTQLAAERVAHSWGWNILPLAERIRSRSVSVPLSHGNPPDDPIEGASPLTLKLMASLDVPAAVRRKQANYRALVERVARLPGVEVPIPSLPEGSVPQVLPVRVSDPAAACRTLRSMGVGACLWPGTDTINDIRLDDYPGASAWYTRGLCLPVHESLEERHLDWTARALARVVGSG